MQGQQLRPSLPCNPFTSANGLPDFRRAGQENQQVLLGLTPVLSRLPPPLAPPTEQTNVAYSEQ